MCSRAALCIARSSEILYAALSGFSWTALREVRHRGVPVARPGRLLPSTVRAPGGAARHQRRENDENNQPVLQRRHSIQRGRPRGLRSRRHSARDQTLLSAPGTFEADRRAPAPVDVLDHDRLDADPDQPIAPVDDLPLRRRKQRRPAVAHRRDLQALLLDDPDELQAGSAAAAAARAAAAAAPVVTGGSGVGRRRRRWRRRLRLKPERIALAPARRPAARRSAPRAGRPGRPDRPSSVAAAAGRSAPD